MSAYQEIRFGDACEVQVLRIVRPDGTVVRTRVARPLVEENPTEEVKIMEDEASNRFDWAEDEEDDPLPEQNANAEEISEDKAPEASHLASETVVEPAAGDAERADARSPPPPLADTSAPPVPQNILEMSLDQRKALLSDPRAVTILAADEEMARIPLLLFQVLSAKGSEVDFSNDQAPVYRIPKALKNGPFIHIRNWLKTYLTTARKMPLLPSADFFRKNVANKELKQDLSIIRAAKLMGMEVYTKHIFKRYWRLLCSDDSASPDDVSKILSLDDVAAISDVALTEEDPFFMKLVKRLGWSMQRQALPDSYLAFLDDPVHARLRSAVDAEMARLKEVEGKRRAAKGSENRAKFETWKMKEERRQADFERKKKERKERNKKAKEGAPKKRDQKIRVVTQDERHHI
ncbi:hypothetical protein BDV96DRAFT_687917 [Lophiotrema nucula]|uniref:Uncharacterized protein n=1 Tax=Lophiotrema nucula TaxID=690887 RepID=A0A6A5Z4U4_9PLEO|nr:hypothetical protein BDV96DRAFT_687917 [Lophiotrema nucula]